MNNDITGFFVSPTTKQSPKDVIIHNPSSRNKLFPERDQSNVLSHRAQRMMRYLWRNSKPTQFTPVTSLASFNKDLESRDSIMEKRRAGARHVLSPLVIHRLLFDSRVFLQTHRRRGGAAHSLCGHQEASSRASTVLVTGIQL